MTRLSDLLNELANHIVTEAKHALSFEKVDVLYTLTASIYLFWILFLTWCGAQFLNMEFKYRSR